ncbi:LMxysn_1693 family intestinal colonization protein [Enterococcus sp. LJL98]
MKKILISGILSGMILFGIAPNRVNADGFKADKYVGSSLVVEDDEFYYVLESIPSNNNRTYSSAQSWDIVKGNRVYQGTITEEASVTLEVSVDVKGFKFNLGGVYSRSGQFKKYKQYAKITVKYNVYRKVDNKFVESKTATSNTWYYDYVAI